MSFVVLVQETRAATLFISPESSQVEVNQEMILDIKIDSQGISFNAAQAVIRFPKETLEVVSLDTTGSVFNFWLEEPTFSNVDGIISFIGGTPFGVSGASVQVLKIVFRTKGSGRSVIALDNAAVIASDGSGTNILIKTIDTSFLVVPKKETPIPPLPLPEQIIRPPVPTGKLPMKPILQIPLYPNEDHWYNSIGKFNVSWELPLDVTDVSTAINKQPNYLPRKSEGLFSNKTFAALSDGIWYLHVRFRNNIGWGTTSHHRLAIDTEPPLGFEIIVLEGEITDNPTPTLQFQTSDALSGIKEYQIQISDRGLMRVPVAEFNGSFLLPLQAPGEHRVIVRAIDYANNSIENSLILKIVPIAPPIITFVTSELFPEEEKGLAIKGIALSEVNVLLRVYRNEALVAESIARSDQKGNWEFIFDQAFKIGNYKITAQSQDARGALSLLVESPLITVKNKPILQIWNFQLGKSETILFLLIILVIGFGAGIWFYQQYQRRMTMRIAFTESEISKIFQVLKSNVDGLKKSKRTSTLSDDDYWINRLEEDIKKMEFYLKRGVKKIK